MKRPISDNSNWQSLLADAVTDPHELCQLLQLDPKHIIDTHFATREFRLRVPRGFVARMQAGNPKDPLLLQVLPQAQEMISTPGYDRDPLQESKVNPVPGLLHKYHGRVLLTLTGACAINCRYCFRRHFPYDDNTPGSTGWQKAVDYIAQDPSIVEVILSGGDPLLMKDAQLQLLLTQLEKISHLKLLRIHTRLPIVLPERMTDELLSLLTRLRLQPVVVVHCNHPQEIDNTVAQALQSLRHAHITVLNQTVLLKNINDNADVLINLSHRLFEQGVLPYYLHLLDPVQGAAHFEVNHQTAQALWSECHAKLPGYLVPRLVQEVAGEKGKNLLLSI